MIDLNIPETDLPNDISKDNDLQNDDWKNNNLVKEIYSLILSLKEVNLYNVGISDILQHTTIDSKYFENIQNPIKLLGLELHQHKYHFYVLVNYNDTWYNKNTLNMNECGIMKIEAIERLCDKIKKITEPKYMELSLRACKFIGLEILDTQSSKVVL